ncbi:MAG: hypothetical protein JST20_02375 [Bacteroidetes bacterium]|nr:hypothetical protein [Bacteroidota bacterium]
MNHPEELFVPIIAILCTFGIPGFVLWKYIEARNKERMAIIEKGMAAEEIRQLFKREHLERRNPNPLSNLKWGLLIFFIGIGIVVGMNTSTYLYNGYSSYNSYNMIPAGILIGGGLGLFIYYLIAAKKEKEAKKEEMKNVTQLKQM